MFIQLTLLMKLISILVQLQNQVNDFVVVVVVDLQGEEDK